MRVLLVDDEELANRRLEILLSDYPDIEIVGSLGSAQEAIDLIQEIRPDAVFLDIEMPQMNGFQLLEALGDGYLPIFVFVTAHADFAIEAFEREAIDYLMKPVERARLKQCVERLRTRLARDEQVKDHRRVMRILQTHRDDTGHEIWNEVVRDDPDGTPDAGVMRVTVGEGEMDVRLANLEWVEAERDYLRLYFSGRSALVRGTMSDMEQRLPKDQFMRVHRSAIVNLDRVTDRRRTNTGAVVLVLNGETEVRVGRKYAAAVNRLIRVQSV